MRSFAIAACTCLIPIGLAAVDSLAQARKPVRALIVDGFSNHDWKQTTIVTKWILEKSALFQVEVSTVPSDGEGRVYNSSLGHLWQGDIYPPAYRCIGFRTTMIRAAEWLATGSVTYPLPDNFPTKDSLSIADEAEFMKSNKR